MDGLSEGHTVEWMGKDPNNSILYLPIAKGN